MAFSLSTGAQASLVARTGGMVYDDVNNITWAADANLFQTQAVGNSNLVNDIIAGNGGVIHDTPNILDTVANSGTYTLTTADFSTSNGVMTWWGAQAWANNLSLGGYTDWTLPTTVTAAYGYNQTGSQMGDLYYTQLGVSSGNNITSSTNPNYTLFTHAQNEAYWSGAENPNPGPNASNYATTFNASVGHQDLNTKNILKHAWAVRSGDVAAVPVPGAFWLFGSAMVGLMGLKRRGSIG